MDKYEEFVMEKVKNGQAIIDGLNPHKAHLLHMAVGVAGEAGELLDAIKKMAVYNNELDLENLIEELGDLEFYMAGIRSKLGISRSSVLEYNQNKLNKRYKKGYTDQAAQERADKQ